MGVTIKNNTELLNMLKTIAQNLPNKDSIKPNLNQTTANASHILSPKYVYLVDENGDAIYTKGTMNNLDNPVYKVGVSGETVINENGYVNSITVKFSDELNDEIATQGELLNQIANLLATKIL